MAATLIDTLIVSLGLDTKAFTKGQKNAADALAKLEKQATQTTQTVKKESAEQAKAAKALSAEQKKATKDAADAKKQSDAAAKKSAKEQGEAWGLVKRELLAASALMMGASGIKTFIQDTVQSAAALDRNSKNLAVNAQELAQWQAANEKAGGTSEAVTEAVARAGDEMARSQVLGEGWNPYLNLFNVDITKAKTPLDIIQRKLKGVQEAYQRVKDQQGTEEQAQTTAHTAAAAMGVEGMYNMARPGQDISALVAAQAPYAKSVTDLSKESENLRIHFWQATHDGLIPFNRVLKSAIPVLENIVSAGGFAMKSAGHTVGIIWDFFTGKTFRGEDTAYTDEATTAAGFKSSSGHITPKGNGTLADKNLNPGNLIFQPYLATQYGATVGAGQSESGAPFAKFPSAEAGGAAMRANIMFKLSHGLDTLSKLISGESGNKTLGWLGSDPKLAGARSAYINNLSSMTGIGANTPFTAAQIGMIQQAMSKVEGGSSETTVNINGPININSNASDGAGLAKDFKAGLQDRTTTYTSFVGMTNSGVKQ